LKSFLPSGTILDWYSYLAIDLPSFFLSFSLFQLRPYQSGPPSYPGLQHFFIAGSFPGLKLKTDNLRKQPAFLFAEENLIEEAPISCYHSTAVRDEMHSIPPFPLTSPWAAE